MRQALIIGGLSVAALGVGVTEGAAQEDLYRSIAYDDPYFTQAPPPERTPRFDRTPTPGDAPAPVPTPHRTETLSYAARPGPVPAPRPATLPTRTPRAVAPAPAPVIRAAPPAAATQAADGAGGRVMRGRIEAVFGWERVRTTDPVDAATVGVVVGADRRIAHLGGGTVFLGPYGAARFSGAEQTSRAQTETTNGTVTTVTQTDAALREEREIELGARLGWATDRAALYASLGYVDARAEAETTVRVTTTDTAAMTTDEETESSAEAVSRDGWRLGAGAEVTVVGDLYWKADYGYAALSEAADRHQVTTGVGLRF